jgi:hypothetical protein
MELRVEFSVCFDGGGAPWITVPASHEKSSPSEHIGHLIGRGRRCSNTTDRPENDSASIHPALSTARLRHKRKY